MLGGMKIIQNKYAFKKHHIGNRIYIHDWHPFWQWFYRRKARGLPPLRDIVKGPPIYETEYLTYVMNNDTIVCHPVLYRELLKSIPKVEPPKSYSMGCYPLTQQGWSIKGMV